MILRCIDFIDVLILLNRWMNFKTRYYILKIQLVDGNTYAQLSAVDLIQQLHCVITLVYKDTALKTVNKEAFRECVKSMLKQSKMFTDKELDAMFA